MKLEAEGIGQWYKDYPNITVLRAEVGAGELFKYVVNGKIVAMLVLTEKQEKEYETVKWQRPESKCLVVKRLAVEPDFRNRGIATELMKFAEDYAVKNGYTSIRLDAYSGNKAALDFYIKRNYHEVGEVFSQKDSYLLNVLKKNCEAKSRIADGSPFFAGATEGKLLGESFDKHRSAAGKTLGLYPRVIFILFCFPEPRAMNEKFSEWVNLKFILHILSFLGPLWFSHPA